MTSDTTAVAPAARPGWRQVVGRLGQPKVAVMLLLGFASGLPFMLVGNTMGFWLREGGIELSAIGFLSWVGLAYSLKFLWAPVVDKVDAPLLGRWLGRRRGWMALSQITVILALAGMAIVKPEGGLMAFAVMALVAAFASATQDIVIDAWRIESSNNGEELALLSAGYQLGYRAALLVTDALILILAAYIGWSISYQAMAMAMGLGLLATFLAREPAAALRAATTHGSLMTGRGLFDAVAGPFIAFFKQHGSWALLMLLTISLYRLPDFVMGPMANPFYADLGIDKETVGAVRGSIGLFASLGGIAAAGLFAVRFGFVATLLMGAILGPGSNLAFAYLAHHGADATVFSIAMVIDNFSTGFAGVALVGYMSSLTNVGYTATQYALLSSFYALLGKVLKGMSGVAVESLEVGRTLLDAYALFFVGTALLGLPALLLCLLLVMRRPPAAPVAEAPGSA
ncbi:AmpG family muropeptide MFS transporter [Novilysobacter spongiicola]|uniref:MFS transporter, PAT family, beta-lactamase induction signal transducer AmpG n=1 Tax=Lysobacter spongiicola DSM 21749 TaxID=1122188 RepID=A0A1T4QAK9_9GAMM|nr:MFS transporter [Lysobacter spongiicola]SKA00735.1 MFS transporter, PAT family, beta-lactamase induction signal transducer AmpG [Lysobacter spongiicola DSM 21749]